MNNLPEQLKIQSEEFSKIIRILSHDINNMLMILQGSVIKLAKATDDKETPKNRALETIERITELMKRIKNIQFLEDPNTKIELRSTSIIDSFRDCKLKLIQQIQNKEIEFLFDATPEHRVMAEPNIFQTAIISELASNSIKFSNQKGKVYFSAETIGDSIEVKIRDQGIGMNEELTTKLFSKSEKTVRPGTLGEKGIGFQMPLIKRYMELFGGSISVKSRSIEEFPNDSGTEFCLVFKKASLI